MTQKGTGKKLTEKQNLILNFIKDSIRDLGYPPTVREIGDEFSITVKGAYDHVKAIEKKGFIRTEQNKSRAIVVLDGDNFIPTNAINIPLVGRIAAGSPILAEENIEEYLSFPKTMFGNGDFFALQVRGDSMMEGGIFDGDLAIIKKQETANNGDIVAALIDEEATLKTFKMKGTKIHLIPENQAYSPIVVDDVTILGTLSAVMRQY
ncbi:MAG: transcriptional repressor LexA [bacterium]|nr:transcriptional repressor LexA [bacterium]